MGNKRMTEADKNNGEYGKPFNHDPTFNGPLYKRSCTDVICLLLFLAFLVGWAVTGYIAFSRGDPARFLSPIDSNGYHCGVDDTVADKPYLFYFDITKCLLPTLDQPFRICNTPQVCIEDCPSVLFIGDLEINTNSSHIKDKLICLNSTIIDHIKNNTDSIKEALSKGECARWYLPTTNVAGHCIPLPNIPQNYINEFQNYTHLNASEVPDFSKAVQLAAQAKEIGETIVRDLKKSWPLIVGGLALAVVFSLVYIILMRWFAGIMVWLSLFGVLALLSYCIYASYNKYTKLKDEEGRLNCKDSVEGCFKSVMALKSTWLAFIIISAFLLAIILIILIFLRKRIYIAIALIGEASKAVSSITSTLAFPVVPWLLQLAVIALAVTIGFSLLAAAKPSYKITQFNNKTCICNNSDYKLGSSCTPQDFQVNCRQNGTLCKDSFCLKVGQEADAYLDYMHIINLFGLFWGLAFMSGFGEMVLAGTFATWYWTYNKSNVPFFTLTHSALRTLRYHMGTLAFGSLILAICRMIRVMLEYMNNKLSKYDNAFVKALMCCLRCFFWCLEKFIRFINHNAYIMCAIHGKNFCKSARDAFNLLMRNIIRVFVLDKVTGFVFFLGKLMITAGIVTLSFYFFSDKLQISEIPELKEVVPDLNYYFVPIIVLGIGTYFITSIFFGVYSMAVDTLFLCFLEDCERNDGSSEKPYFMSKQLMKILGKSNHFKER